MFTELKTTARGLARTPLVSVAAIICLALGIGATASISSAISRALLQPLPLVEPERLVAVHRVTPNSGPMGTWPHSAANYIDFAARTRTLTGLAALGQANPLIAQTEGGVQVSGMRATGNFFRLIGARAALGRLIQPDDDQLDVSPVIVLSDNLWRQQFGGDSSLVGRKIQVDGVPTTVIGVLPPDFRVPHGGNYLRPDAWLAMRFTPAAAADRGSNFLLVLGRLAPGQTAPAAETELRRIFADIVDQNPNLRGENVRAAPLQAENLQPIRRPLMMLFGAVCIVLLIAATNVAALLLARGVQRRREMAVRVALGASGWDTARPLLLESLMLTGVGAAAGLAVALIGTKTIGALAAARMPQLVGLKVDGRVLLFALTLSAIVAVLCAAVPAWRSRGADPQDALRSGRGSGTGAAQHRALMGLVVGEIALSLTLLIGAGLVLKGFAGLLANDPGFETSHVLVANVTVAGTRYPDNTAAARFIDPLTEAAARIPGVEAAGAINVAPYVNWGWNGGIRYEGEPKLPSSKQHMTEFRSANPGFFAVTRQRLLAGRLLSAADDERAGNNLVTVVNEALVARDFKGRNPIGQRFHTSDTTFGTIVGVVSNVRNAGPVAEPRPEMYYTFRQASPGTTGFSLMVRAAGDDPRAVAKGLRDALRGVDPTAALSSVQAMPDVIGRTLGQPRFYFSLLGSFAAVAALLAMAGLYGVLSYAVAQRTREIGIRGALGSTRGRIIGLIGAMGMRLVALGIVLGLAGGLLATRLMVSMLYGVSPLDPVAWVGAALLTLVAGAFACVMPALRASGVPPSIAMQAE